MSFQSIHQGNSLHQGVFFGAVAVFFWGILAIALKLTTNFIDSFSLTWIRFLAAAIITFAIQAMLGKLYEFKRLSRRDWLVLFTAGLLLLVNYNTFVISLQYIHPGTAQLNFQTAPFYLVFGGAVFFHEKLKLAHWLCILALAAGLALFFYPSIASGAGFGGEQSILGLIIVHTSSLAWSAYALMQKPLIKKLSPQNILLAIYIMGVVLLAPLTDFQSFSGQSTENWLIIAFCTINTLIAYGSFTQAMKTIGSVQMGALVALTAIITFAASALCVWLAWWPDTITSAGLTWISGFGIVLVVAGAIAIQLIPRKA